VATLFVGMYAPLNILPSDASRNCADARACARPTSELSLRGIADRTKRGLRLPAILVRFRVMSGCAKTWSVGQAHPPLAQASNLRFISEAFLPPRRTSSGSSIR